MPRRRVWPVLTMAVSSNSEETDMCKDYFIPIIAGTMVGLLAFALSVATLPIVWC